VYVQRRKMTDLNGDTSPAQREKSGHTRTEQLRNVNEFFPRLFLEKGEPVKKSIVKNSSITGRNGSFSALLLVA
jgi:hypothetical protein